MDSLLIKSHIRQNEVSSKGAKLPRRFRILRAVLYDFDKRQFTGGDGKPFTEADFRRAAASESGGRKARAGISTLKRAAVTNALLRAANQSRGRERGSGNTQQLNPEKDSDLKEVLYKRTPSPASAGFSVEKRRLLKEILLK